MPVYCYKCPLCEAVESIFRSISCRNVAPQCPECGAAIMDRDIVAEGTNTPMQEYHKPIEMYSVAPTSADEVTELRRKLPNVKFNDQFVPIAHSRHEKLAILKATGFLEQN